MAVPTNKAAKILAKQPSKMMTVKKTYEFDPKTDLIGKGGFGSVYKAVDTNLGITVAIKKYTGNLPAKYSLFEEIKRAIQLSHPNLIRYYDAFELENSSTFGDKIQVGVLEFANSGDFYTLLRKRPNTEVIGKIIYGILKGLKYLHENNIIHRDMKPENVLLHHQNGQLVPKIADFGISKVLDDEPTGSSMIIGTIAYMAPEQFNMVKYGKDGKLHTNLDLWSLGTIIYEAFVGTAPFGKTEHGISRSEVMRNILDKEVDGLEKIPEPFREMVKRCLCKYARDRAQSVDELLWLYEDYYDSHSAYASIFNNPRSTTNLDTAVLNEELQKLPTYDPQNPSPSALMEPAVPSKDLYYSDSADQGYDSGELASGEESEAVVAENTSSNTKVGISPWAVLFPIYTALAMLAVYLGRGLFFGGSSKASMLLYPALIGAILFVINLFSVFIRKRKYSFEWITYTLSFLVLIYFMAKSIILYQYSNMPTGLVFDFGNHSFAKIFPIIAVVLLIFSGIMTFVNRKK